MRALKQHPKNRLSLPQSLVNPQEVLGLGVYGRMGSLEKGVKGSPKSLWLGLR